MLWVTSRSKKSAIVKCVQVCVCPGVLSSKVRVPPPFVLAGMELWELRMQVQRSHVLTIDILAAKLVVAYNHMGEVISQYCGYL